MYKQESKVYCRKANKVKNTIAEMNLSQFNCYKNYQPSQKEFQEDCSFPKIILFFSSFWHSVYPSRIYDQDTNIMMKNI
jgi:hypothetical protein